MPEKINRNEVQTLVRNGAQIIEVLGASEFETAHLPDAIHIPLWELNTQSIAAKGVAKDRATIVYCHDYQ